MINSINSAVQVVNSGGNVLFSTDRVRTNSCGCGGWLAHDLGSGIFTLTKGGIYKIEYSANITSATAGQASLELEQNGESISGTESIYTIATANDYGGLSSSCLVRVPCNASYTITLGNNSALSLSVSDANIVIERLA